MDEHRLIICSNDTGIQESVIFLDPEDDTPAEDYCRPSETVDFDGIIKADLPTSFPLNWTLNRE